MSVVGRAFSDPECWHLCCGAEDRCRAEVFPRILRRLRETKVSEEVTWLEVLSGLRSKIAVGSERCADPVILPERLVRLRVSGLVASILNLMETELLEHRNPHHDYDVCVVDFKVAFHTLRSRKKTDASWLFERSLVGLFSSACFAAWPLLRWCPRRDWARPSSSRRIACDFRSIATRGTLAERSWYLEILLLFWAALGSSSTATEECQRPHESIPCSSREVLRSPVTQPRGWLTDTTDTSIEGRPPSFGFPHGNRRRGRRCRCSRCRWRGPRHWIKSDRFESRFCLWRVSVQSGHAAVQP